MAARGPIPAGCRWRTISATAKETSNLQFDKRRRLLIKFWRACLRSKFCHFNAAQVMTSVEEGKRRRMLSNYYPIFVEPSEVSLRCFPYSEQRLASLRSQHNSTHSFFRLGEMILCVWNDGRDIEGGEHVLVKPEDSPEAIDRMIRHLCFRTLRKELPGLKPLSFYPIRIVSRRSSHDVLRQFLPGELHGIVCLNLMIELQVRRILHKTKLIPHLVVDMRRRWAINRSLSDLASEGFPLIGVSVVQVEPVAGLEEVLAPAEASVGKVVSITGDLAKVQTFEGLKQFKLDELALRKTKSAILDYLTFKLGSREATRVMDSVFSLGSLSSDAEDLHKEIEEMAGYFSRWQFQTKSGFAFKVVKDASVHAPSLRIEPSRFLFDVTPGAGATSPLSGLLRFGPYDSTAFRPKEPRLLVVCQQSNRGGFAKAAAAFANGIPEAKYFQKGFKDLFRLHKVHWDIAEAKGPTPQQFCDAIRSKVENNEFDLVIVEGDEEQKSLPPEQNSFIRSKALLLGMGIPVQGIKHENVRKSDFWLGSVLGPTALQVYAKLGGIPWTLPASQDVDREIVVGIGSIEKKIEDASEGRGHRIVGMTTFFANDGRFIMAGTCKAVPYEEYFAELLRSLENSIRVHASDNNWEQGDTVRIIFHIFKPIKYIEAEVVAELVKKFPEYDIKFAFVTISTNHPLLLFDENHSVGPKEKGNFVPLRGTNIKVSDLECLIQLRGRGEIKTSRQGFSPPALVRIHEKSTFTDLHYIVQQVVNFTYLSWKTFFATSLPVSIFYAEEIAKWLDRFDGLPGWNPEIINTALKRKKWFL